MLKIKKFDKKIEKEKQKAQELYNKKQNTVVCQYCGQLLKKEEADSIYDIEKKELTFCHSECFDKYEYQGTLEDLVGEKNEIQNK